MKKMFLVCVLSLGSSAQYGLSDDMFSEVSQNPAALRKNLQCFLEEGADTLGREVGEDAGDDSRAGERDQAKHKGASSRKNRGGIHICSGPHVFKTRPVLSSLPPAYREAGLPNRPMRAFYALCY
uniref:Secreted protein n=1 Tax=Ixodes scapularis TaxID=6945 RepID=A0A4D5S7Q2_IXOSC